MSRNVGRCGLHRSLVIVLITCSGLIESRSRKSLRNFPCWKLLLVKSRRLALKRLLLILLLVLKTWCTKTARLLWLIRVHLLISFRQHKLARNVTGVGISRLTIGKLRRLLPEISTCIIDSINSWIVIITRGTSVRHSRPKLVIRHRIKAWNSTVFRVFATGFYIVRIP